jgi:hypothetical protein
MYCWLRYWPYSERWLRLFELKNMGKELPTMRIFELTIVVVHH